MRSRNDDRGLLIPFLQVVTDIVAIEASLLFSWWLRFHSPLTSLVPVTRGIPSLEIYMLGSAVVTIVMLSTLGSTRMYGVRRNASRVDEVTGIARSMTLGMILIAAGAFFYREYSFSRLVFVYLWISGIVFLGFTRILILEFEKARHRRRKGLVRAAIIGSSDIGTDLFRRMHGHAGLGIEIAGYAADAVLPDSGMAHLGSLDDIPAIIEKERLGALFFALGERESARMVDILNSCTGLHVEFYLVPDMTGLVTSRLRVEEFEGFPLLKIKDTAITGWGAVFKRTFDIVMSMVALLLLSPFFIVAALAVKAGSKGPVFYRQERIGRDGRVFDLLKFRSMRTDAEEGTGPVWTVEGDDRVTAAGKWLRRTSIDELPQLVNVLKGEMSLVGPRPERPHFVDRFKEDVPKYLERHRVRSGMTGWAQVNGLRGDVPIERRTKYDVYYVENWSVALDIKILVRTLWTVVRGVNSY